MFLEKRLMFSPEAAVAFVGVEAAAWIRAWGGIRMVARGGLLDSSKEKVRHTLKAILNFVCETTFIGNNKHKSTLKHWLKRKKDTINLHLKLNQWASNQLTQKVHRNVYI